MLYISRKENSTKLEKNCRKEKKLKTHAIVKTRLIQWRNNSIKL